MSKYYRSTDSDFTLMYDFHQKIFKRYNALYQHLDNRLSTGNVLIPEDVTGYWFIDGLIHISGFDCTATDIENNSLEAELDRFMRYLEMTEHLHPLWML